jgi:hypothetical protein
MSTRGAIGRAATVLALLFLGGCERSSPYFDLGGGTTGPGPGVDSGPSCSASQLLCNGGCIAPLTDNANCGSCGNMCQSGLSSCLGGSCSCLSEVCLASDGGLVCSDDNCGAPPGCGGCAPGFSQCRQPDGGCGYCADTTTDPENCGGCGIACGLNEKCTPQGAMGVCVCDTTSPGGADLILCGNGCVHEDTDPLNCGGCGNPCQSGSCNGGMCAASLVCNVDAGLFACTPTACTDVTRDAHNCGSCGNDCTLGGTLTFPGIECFLGYCLCQSGQDYICPGPVTPFPTFVCIDTTSDPNNCGGCGLLADGGGPYDDGGFPPSSHICNGVRTTCQNGACFCPNDELHCPPGTWLDDAGNPEPIEACLNATEDPFNCGTCGNECQTTYAADSVCLFASCTCIDAGLCVSSVSAANPLNPSCDCNGIYSATAPNPDCSSGASVTFLADIFPLLSANTVTDQPTWGAGGVLIGCAVSGCHDSTAAAGLNFTDPDASYQQLFNGSSICPGQPLVLPNDGMDSLLYQLLTNTFVCPAPDGGIASPMPIDDAGGWHPLSACLATQVRQWIDQGAAY